jgi:hypothetical protein
VDDFKESGDSLRCSLMPDDLLAGFSRSGGTPISRTSCDFFEAAGVANDGHKFIAAMREMHHRI